ncbi:THO complex subunit 3 [Candida viswanathii]|uniref:THO complex subunit 3 n=1 Tax=Candida viswanathii TaxID=5486 RepID=A0A367YI11_9ASCO|nr:THO complex subunit 3 [Candida viswanathii]
MSHVNSHVTEKNKAFFKKLTPFVIRDKPVGSYMGNSEVITMAINVTGTRIVYSRTDKSIRIWKSTPDAAVDPKVIIDPHAKAVESISFNPRTEYLFATVGKDEYVRIWSAQTGEKIREIKCEFDTLKLVRYSQDGKLLVVVDRTSNILVLAVEMNYKVVHRFKVNEHVYDLQWFYHEHQFLLIAMHDGSVLLYEITEDEDEDEDEENGGKVFGTKLRSRVKGHNSSITSIAISPRGNYFCLGNSEGVVSFWTVDGTLLNLHVISDIDQSISHLDSSRDSAYVSVAYDADSNLRIYDYESGELVHEIPNSISGSQTFSSAVWFPTKTCYIFTSDHGTTVTLMKRSDTSRLEGGGRKRDGRRNA